MNNKYAEGYPGRRYYGGCEYVDRRRAVRRRARAKALFGAEHANAQPHGRSGEPAVMGAFLQPGKCPDDTVLARARARGTSHTARRCKRLWHVVHLRGLRGNPRTERARHGQASATRARAPAEDPAGGFTAYPRGFTDFAAFPCIADEVGASCGSMPRTSSGSSRAVRGNLEPGPARRRRHLYVTHKTLRGLFAVRFILCREEHAKAIDKAVFPMMQGGPDRECLSPRRPWP